MYSKSKCRKEQNSSVNFYPVWNICCYIQKNYLNLMVSNYTKSMPKLYHWKYNCFNFRIPDINANLTNYISMREPHLSEFSAQYTLAFTRFLYPLLLVLFTGLCERDSSSFCSPPLSLTLSVIHYKFSKNRAE